MQKPRDQLAKFFKELDAVLDEKYELIIIGGTAMVLGYESERMTHDCDPWNKAAQELLDKWKIAAKKSNVELGIDTQAGVAQLPYEFEGRLQEADLKLKKLTIKFPEKYDLALSKISRLLGNDLDDILWLNQNHGLDFDVLLKRYLDEFRSIYVGHTRGLDLNFLDAVEELYGEGLREKAEKHLGD